MRFSPGSVNLYLVPRISQAAFARLCGVSPPAVKQAANRGTLVADETGIDPAHPLSVAYLQRVAERATDPGPRSRRPPLDGMDPIPAPAKPRGQTPRKRTKAKRQAAPTFPQAPGNPGPGPAPVPSVEASPMADPSAAVQGSEPAATPSSEQAPRAPAPRGRPPMTVDRQTGVAVLEIREIEKAHKAIKLQDAKIAYLARVRKLMPAAWHYRSIGRIAAVLNDHLRTFGDRCADQLEAMAKDGAGRTQFADFLDAEMDKAMKAVQKTLDREIQEWRDEEASEGEPRADAGT